MSVSLAGDVGQRFSPLHGDAPNGRDQLLKPVGQFATIGTARGFAFRLDRL